MKIKYPTEKIYPTLEKTYPSDRKNLPNFRKKVHTIYINIAASFGHGIYIILKTFGFSQNTPHCFTDALLCFTGAPWY